MCHHSTSRVHKALGFCTWSISKLPEPHLHTWYWLWVSSDSRPHLAHRSFHVKRSLFGLGYEAWKTPSPSESNLLRVRLSVTLGVAATPCSSSSCRTISLAVSVSICGIVSVSVSICGIIEKFDAGRFFSTLGAITLAVFDAGRFFMTFGTIVGCRSYRFWRKTLLSAHRYVDHPSIQLASCVVACMCELH